MLESMPRVMRGEVTIFDFDRPERIFLQKKNVICNSVSFLAARLFASPAEPLAGIWGLALGQGGTSGSGWSSIAQPDPTVTTMAMVSEIKRKALYSTKFVTSGGVDGDGNTIWNVSSTPTSNVQFSTLINATTDAITMPIREMGLIGGGTTVGTGSPTNMLTAPYFDPSAPVNNSVVLVNYVTLPPFIAPPSVSLGISWVLTL
jgi:hypothetical protein